MKRIGGRMAWMTIVALLCVAAAGGGTPGDRPPVFGLFGDNMILQRDRPVPVWGWAEPGTAVTVRFGDRSGSAVAAAPSGRWQAELAPMPADNAGKSLTVQLGEQKIEFRNVVVGDVWLAGGQSNMEMGIMGTNQWWNQIGDNPNLRLYLNPLASSPVRRDRTGGAWKICNYDALNDKLNPGGFSAIAYLFARDIQKKLGIPIGVIQSCIGNTDIGAWCAPEIEAQFGKNSDPRTEFGKMVEAEFAKGDPAHAATAAWKNPDFDDSGWGKVRLPRRWFDRSDRKCLVWLRRTVEVPAAWRDGMIYLHLGSMSHYDTVWANGRFVGATEQHNRSRFYEIPGEWVRDGRLQLTIRLMAEGGFLGKKADLWLLGENATADRKISLAGVWRCKASTPAAQCRIRTIPDRWIRSGGYQAMIAPLAPFALKGFLWYQGCGNVGNTRNYTEIFRAMILDWRKIFRAPDAPFYCVQLAGFGKYPETPPAGSGWAEIRKIQSDIEKIAPNTGFATAFDRGDERDIHPAHKVEVAARLAGVALAKTYGVAAAYRGPAFKSARRDGAKVRIVFDHAEGLHSVGGVPAGFAVTGAAGKPYWAHAEISGNAVTVWSPHVADPVAVSYGWADNTLANVYNSAKLPMVPFRERTE